MPFPDTLRRLQEGAGRIVGIALTTGQERNISPPDAVDYESFQSFMRSDRRKTFQFDEEKIQQAACGDILLFWGTGNSPATTALIHRRPRTPTERILLTLDYRL